MDESFICAGGKLGVDTCKGDGGSPLVCQKQQGTWYQAGIVSFGIGCGETGFPAVYADVSFASCWIDRQVRFMVRMILLFGLGFGLNTDVWFMVYGVQAIYMLLIHSKIFRFPSSMARLKDPLILDLPKKIVQNLVKNST